VTAALVAARLRRLVEADEVGEPPPAEDVTWLTARLRAYLAGASAGLTLEQAFGLATAPGGCPWWRAERLAARDRTLRRLGATLEGKVTARAHALALKLRDYAGRCWRRDAARGGPFPITTERRLLFEVFTLDPDPPTSVRALIDILQEERAANAAFPLHDPAGTLPSGPAG
jgi:hypothetical protein